MVFGPDPTRANVLLISMDAEDWGYSSEAEQLCIMKSTLGSLASPEKKQWMPTLKRENI